jgi:hypothetical protein
MRTDTPEEARKRLHGALYHRSVEGNPSLYEHVTRLSSLKYCLEQHNITGVEIKTNVKAKLNLTAIIG